MARGTFFLRDQVVAPATQNRTVTEIDLGAYVNLGSTKPQVLRIHSIQVAFTDSEGLVPLVDAAAAVAEFKSAFACVALTTKEMAIASPQMPFLSDDETVYTRAIVSSNGETAKNQGITSGETDLAPQHLENGYLVGVDTLYLYGIADDAWDEDIYMSICMECSVEPATRENAINLALSQN